MKRLIPLLAMVLFIAAAQAQNITNAEYFFDSDPGQGNAAAITVAVPGTTVNINTTISTASLGTGFHFIGVRVKEATGIWSLFEKRGFYISGTTSDAANISAAEYFLDTDPGVGNGTALPVGTTGAAVNFTANIPTSLPPGFHFLAIRVKGTDGQWGLFEKRGFYISSTTANAANIVAAEYFLDTDPGLGNGTALPVGTAGATVNFTASIPTSLAPGFHFLAIRVKGSDDQWGHYEKRGFYVSAAAVDASNITAAEYFVDTDPGVGNGTALSIGTAGATVNFTANIPTSLSQGFHFLAIRTKNADGQWGLFEKRGFYISNTTVDATNIVAAEYFFDADPGVGNATALSVTTPGAIVTQTVDIPEPSLTLGMHFFAIRVKDANGIWSLYEYDTLNIGNSTISCPADASASANTGECAAIVNNIDPTVNPQQAYTYTLTGATTGTGTGTASGSSFNEGVTTVNYKLTGSPSVNCSFTVTVTAAAPAISSQPASQSACAGTNISFSVVAAGSGLTYQWRKSGVDISGANTASYSINNVTNADAGNYDVVISNTCGLSVTSSTASLTVGNTAITSQPANQAVCAGASASFSVTATGSSLSYQWRKGGVDISGANAASYTINNVTNGDAGNYDVLVTGSCGNATSNTAPLTVNAATAISTNPANQTVCTGSNVTFTAAATGTGTITYQWRKAGVNIPGANTASYTINGITNADAANYDVVATGTCGSATSPAATLTVNAASAITAQPANQASCIGGTVTFIVSATGTNVTYQWQKAGVDITGATAASYTINSVVAGDAGTYNVVIVGSCGTVTSNNATLVITAGTTINTQPASQVSCVGGSATFTVSASGSGTVTYQWKKNGADINGATSSSLVINPVAAGDAANYTVVVSSGCGNTESSTAALSITPATAITSQPADQTVCAGSPATFIVNASGDNLIYQWRKDGIDIGGAVSSSYSIAAVAAGDFGNYDAVITGTCGTVTSSTASLATFTVAITTQPASQTVFAGASVTFTVTATGNNLSYQWRKDGADITGATNSSYTITTVAVADAGNYDVVVTGSCPPSVTSNTAVLTVNPFAITTQPTNRSVCSGSDATFSIVVSGTGLTYQWQQSTGGGTFTDMDGETSSSLTLASVALTSNGNQYRCVINGNLNSNAATLTVNASPMVTFDLPYDTLYLNSHNQIVTGGSPSGGTYTGSAITNGVIRPGQLSLGDYGIVYRYTDANGCAASASDSFTVIPKALFTNIFPNPSKDGNMTIIVAAESVGKKALVYDAAGKKVYEWIVAGRYSQLHLGLPAGTYTFVFSWRYGYITEQVVIVR